MTSGASLVTISQAADKLGLHYSTVRYYVLKGELEAVYIEALPHVTLISVDEVESFKRKRKKNRTKKERSCKE